MAAIIKRRYLREVDLPVPIPSGTAMLFMQAAAPTGWTKSTTHNDKAIRIVSGTGGGSGGSSAFSTVFGKTATDNTTLTAALQASMTANIGVVTTYGATPANPGIYLGVPGGAGSGTYASNGGTGYTILSMQGTAFGGGGAHNHGMDIRVRYVDAIICAKD